jgi:hypothetical protein
LQFVLGILSLQQRHEEEEFRGYVRIVKKKKDKVCMEIERRRRRRRRKLR